jgi:hypothetical protein
VAYTGPDWQPILRDALPRATDRAISHYVVALRELWTYGNDEIVGPLRRIAAGEDLAGELISLDISLGVVRRGMFVFHPRLEELYAALTHEEFPDRDFEASSIEGLISKWWQLEAEDMPAVSEAVMKARRALPALQYRLDLIAKLRDQTEESVRDDLRQRLDAVLEQVTFLRAALGDD